MTNQAPKIADGVRPVKACVIRLFEAEFDDLPRLLACPFAPEGLKQAAVESHPQTMAARRADVASAAAWERSRYGCILVDANPYYFRARRDERRKAAGNVYQIVTERIIQSLEQGLIPWRRPWKVAGHPRNFISTKPYRGINVLLLATQGYSSPYWLTYKQAAERGAHVHKGEKSTPIVFWNVKQTDKPAADGEGVERDRRFTLRYYSVFNLEQTTLAPADAAPVQPLASCSAVVDAWQEKPRIILDDPKVCQAEYFPKLDTITMPLMSRFISSEHYFSTLYHEMVHYADSRVMPWQPLFPCGIEPS
jgi:hypothetical protein